MTLILLNYNNYYNRIVKRHSTPAEYIENGAKRVAAMTNVTFNPNDGVTTTQIFNIPFDIVPDYALVVDEDNEIISRWYILEAARTRAGQYQIDLLRDLIADSYEEIITAPMFVEKAMLSRNDPRIFNNEAMSFNQIKTSETLLKDKTNVPWIVGYIARNTDNTEISVPEDASAVNYELPSLDGYQYYQYTSENPYKMSYADFTAKMYIRSAGLNPDLLQVGWDASGYPKMPVLEVSNDQLVLQPSGTYCTRNPKSGYRFASTFNTPINVLDQVLDHTYDLDWVTDSYSMTNLPLSPLDLSGEDGKIIKVGSDYYRIKYHQVITGRELITVDNTMRYGLMFQQVADQCDKLKTGNYINPVGAIEYTCNAAYFTYEFINLNSFSVLIDSNRNKLSDAPYDAFAIPYGNLELKGLSETVIINPYVSMRVAQYICTTLGTQLYDLQILPFCPIISDSGVNMTGKVEHRDYEWVKVQSGDKEVKSSILFWLNTSSFSVNIPISINVPENAIDFKIANECDRYRIVSPTYSGEFEFSAAKNNGVSSFSAYCTYKPYNPFIKVVPLFKGLYGQEYLDGRGCICQGDFSLPQISDAWVQYQISNKNFLNAFNRQVENMEVNNSIQRELEKWQVASGVITGAASGAVSGGIAGGTWGAVAGGVVGGAASLIGGIKDIQLAEKLRSEALDYTKDQFGYQLGNIKALPYSLANIGAQTIISKYFPMLEYYTCTTVEKDALRDKIKYNGMTVGTIGTIQDFQQSTQKTYIKGKLIRLENSNEEYHYVNAIANELNKGVFI